MSETLLRHILTKNTLDIVVDFLIFMHFHFMKIHRSPLSLQRQNIFRQVAFTLGHILVICNIYLRTPNLQHLP